MGTIGLLWKLLCAVVSGERVRARYGVQDIPMLLDASESFSQAAALFRNAESCADCESAFARAQDLLGDDRVQTQGREMVAQLQAQLREDSAAMSEEQRFAGMHAVVELLGDTFGRMSKELAEEARKLSEQ